MSQLYLCHFEYDAKLNWLYLPDDENITITYADSIGFVATDKDNEEYFDGVGECINWLNSRRK